MNKLSFPIYGQFLSSQSPPPAARKAEVLRKLSAAGLTPEEVAILGHRGFMMDELDLPDADGLTGRKSTLHMSTNPMGEGVGSSSITETADPRFRDRLQYGAVGAGLGGGIGGLLGAHVAELDADSSLGNIGRRAGIGAGIGALSLGALLAAAARRNVGQQDFDTMTEGRNAFDAMRAGLGGNQEG